MSFHYTTAWALLLEFHPALLTSWLVKHGAAIHKSTESKNKKKYKKKKKWWADWWAASTFNWLYASAQLNPLISIKSTVSAGPHVQYYFLLSPGNKTLDRPRGARKRNYTCHRARSSSSSNNNNKIVQHKNKQWNWTKREVAVECSPEQSFADVGIRFAAGCRKRCSSIMQVCTTCRLFCFYQSIAICLTLTVGPSRCQIRRSIGVKSSGNLGRQRQQQVR